MPYKDKHDRTCGFLDIDEEDKRKKFQRRFFVLNKNKGLLEWYMDSPTTMGDSAQPCGMINIGYITKVDEATKMKKDYCFVINTPFRPYYVQASSQNELNTWIQILNDASKITVPPEALHPSNPKPNLVVSSHSQDGLNNGNNDTVESYNSEFTYRTEIVGNVVVKKKLSDLKKPSVDEPPSPSFNSVDSDIKNPRTPDSVSLHTVFFNAFDDKDVVKKGWAVKQGHVRKNWKRRFFVLKKDGFAYYKSEHDREPIRTVSIKDVLAAKAEEGEASKLRDNLLLVATTDKIYYMQADTPEDMSEWITAFNDAIQANRATSITHQVSNAKTKAIDEIDGRSLESKGGKSPLLSPHSQSTSNLFPVVPVLSPLSMQVTYQEGYGLGRSVELLDEAHPAMVTRISKEHLKKRSSAQSIPFKTSQDSMGYSTCSTDSLDKVSPIKTNSSHRQFIKTHRRAESAVTGGSKSSVESMFSGIHGNKQLRNSVAYGIEDVQPRPESVNLSSLSEKSEQVHYGSSSKPGKPIGGNYVTNHLDPQVDMRSAVKPSLVKKKKNHGILFPLNTMLNRKQDKIQKEKQRYRK